MKQYMQVRFENSAYNNLYTYSAPDHLKISKGDTLIVKVEGKVKIVQVVNLIKDEKDVTFPLHRIKSIHATLNVVDRS